MRGSFERVWGEEEEEDSRARGEEEGGRAGDDVNLSFRHRPLWPHAHPTSGLPSKGKVLFLHSFNWFCGELSQGERRRSCQGWDKCTGEWLNEEESLHLHANKQSPSVL